MAIHAQSSCTLSTITDVEAVYTYYYLSDSTITIDEAPKDGINPPGASTITIISDGNSYTWQITEPQLDIQDDIIQTAVGKLYYIECVKFSDETYDWGPLMTSSTYAAAKAAYNLSSQALSQAQAANEATALLGGHFLYNSTWQTTNTPHSANVVQTIIKNGIDVSNDPTKWDYNVHIGANGIRLRNNEFVLSEWTSTALKFNNPSTGNAQLIIGANGALQSGDYNRGSNSKFASAGTKIDLTRGDIITQYFRLSQGFEAGVTAGAYIHGTIEAVDGRIGGFTSSGQTTTNYWDIGNYTDYNLQNSAKLIGHGSSFIQLGDDFTWRIATNRIHTGWYESGDSYLHFPIFSNGTANRRWDYGIHVPQSRTDKFLYIRTASATTDASNLIRDLEDTQTPAVWTYKFWIDGEGRVHAPGFYIGDSSTPIGGGAGTIAEKLISGAGSSNQPVYFRSDVDHVGEVAPINYTINKSVPSDAIFTDHITSATTTGNGNAVTSVVADENGNLTVTKNTTFLTSYTETDPTVPAWAKASTKPSYSYSEITGTVPQSALPSYVDDVLEYNGQSSFPTTGESGKIYVDTSTNKTYRWGGTTYVEISPSLALGETSSTAYRGDRGKIAYDHASAKGSAFTSGLYKITTNSEGHVTAATAAGKSDIGLGNVDNKSSATIRSEITSANVTDALGFTPYDVDNPNGYITSADVSDTHVNVSTRGSTKAYLLATTSSPTSTKTAREAVAETEIYLETSNSATRLVAPTFVGALTGTASGNLTSNSSLAWGKVTGADDLKAIENLSGTTGLLRKTAANTWELDTTNYLSSFTESDPVFSASAASSITNSDITNWNGKTSNTGTVTSVRVQATSPVKSSVSTAQSSSLNTTISLEDAYGDLKNPYGSKTARYVLAAPASAAGVPSFRALTNADVGLNNVINTKQITNITNEFQDGVNTGRLVIWKGENDSQVLEVQITAREATTATNATNDSDGDPINTTYGTSLGWTGSTRVLALKNKGGTNLSTVTISDADTTYTFASGTNGFTVTPKGGNAQTVTVTPSITNNVTGSGTSGKLVKWNGTNTITDGPTFTSGGTGYLKEDGTWGTPGGTYSLPIATYNVLGGLKPWYSTTGASTLASGSSGAHSDTPSINARSATAGKYYAVEIDKNGRLFVNVPWTNTNGSYLTSAVTTLTTQAGGHTTVTSVSGDVTIKIPTATSHLTNDSGYITGYVDEKVKLTSKSDNVAYKITLGPSSITSGTAYEGYYSTNLTYNPSTKELVNGTNKLKSASSTTANTAAYDTLTLGNNIAVSSTTAHSQGQLILYGSTAFAHTIQGAPTAARTITLPDKGGTIALTSDLPDISGKIDTAGTGLSKSGTTLNHSNSVSAQTTQAVYPIKIDAQGHISAYGSAQTILSLGTGSSNAYRGDYGNTAYTHATDSGRLTTAQSSAFYKFSVTAQGHVGSVTAVTASDITGLLSFGTTYNASSNKIATMSDVSGAIGNYLTYNVNEGVSAKKIFAQGTSFGSVTNKTTFTEKANMKYDSTLDALIFTFV